MCSAVVVLCYCNNISRPTGTCTVQYIVYTVVGQRAPHQNRLILHHFLIHTNTIRIICYIE